MKEARRVSKWKKVSNTYYTEDKEKSRQEILKEAIKQEEKDNE